MAGPWSVRTRKPHGSVRINFAHPLARDIAFFYYETQGVASGAASFYDAVTGKLAGTSSGQTANTSSDPVGGGNTNLFLDGTSRSTGTAFINPRAVTTELLTVFSRFKPTAKPASRGCVLFYGSAGGGRGSYVGLDSSGFAQGGLFTSNGMNSLSSDAVDHTNQWINVGGGGDGATGGTGIAWVNGVKQAAVTNGISSGQTVSLVNIGRDPTGYYNNITAEVAVFIGWNRVLSDLEHKQLSANPWQLLLPQLNVSFFSAGTVGASNPTFTIAGVGAQTLLAASSLASSGLGAVTVQSAASLSSIGLGALTALSAARVSMAGTGALAALAASALSSAGIGAFNAVPGSIFPTFSIAGVSAPTLKAAMKFSPSGLGAFSPQAGGGITFAFAGSCVTVFLGPGWRQPAAIANIWTIRPPVSPTWSVASPPSNIWTRIL